MRRQAKDFLHHGETAILVSEMQEGIFGEHAPLMAQRTNAMSTGVLPNLVAFLATAREIGGINIFHCTAERRADGFGDPLSSPLARMLAHKAGPGYGLETGTANAEPLAELYPRDSKNDYVMPRLLGMSPFYGTDLDYFLRHSGVKNLVVTGTSLNVALLGTAIEATNIGYHVVLAKDCAICDPPEYAEQLIKYTVRHLCYISTSTEIIDCWKNQLAG